MGPRICPSVVTLELDQQLIPQMFHKYKKQPYEYILEVMRQVRQQKMTLQIQQKYKSFFHTLSSYYNNVPYHNITHAFDVMTAIDKYIKQYGMKEQLNIKGQQRIYILIAAYAHDNGHEGLTNNFYINSQSDLAIKYSNISPLQNMHSSNLLSCFRLHQIEVSKQFKQLMVSLILATDNKHHFELLQKIKRYQSIINRRIIEQLDQEEKQIDKSGQIKCRSTLLQMMIHTADISPCGKSVDQYMKWNQRLYEQFKGQYRKQRQLKLKTFSFNFDLNNMEYSIIQSNLGFFNNLVLPFFKQVSIIMPNFKKQLSNALKIKDKCDDLIKKHEKKQSNQIQSSKQVKNIREQETLSKVTTKKQQQKNVSLPKQSQKKAQNQKVQQLNNNKIQNKQKQA